MQTIAITQHLLQLTRLRFVNAFLVREPDGFTLVDTTLPRGGQELIAVAERAGGSIRRIALTHGHGDHVGSLDELQRALGPSVQVLMPELDARILAGEQVDDARTGGWPKIQTTPDVLLRGGEQVGSLEVVASPGHTPGHVAFVDSRDRTLIAGDVFTTVGSVAVTNRFNLRFPFAAVATGDRQQDLQSAKELRALEPAILVAGHGRAVRRPGPALDQAIARAEG